MLNVNTSVDIDLHGYCSRTKCQMSDELMKTASGLRIMKDKKSTYEGPAPAPPYSKVKLL